MVVLAQALMGKLARRADWTVLDFFKLLGAGLVVVGELTSRTSSDSGVWLRVVMDSQSKPNDQLPADPGLTAQQDAGNDQTATIDGGGVQRNPEDIVDDVLTDLPGPSRDHVFAHV